MAFDAYNGSSGNWLASSAFRHGIEKQDFSVATWIYRVAGYSGTFWYSNGSVGSNFAVGLTNFSGGSWFIWCSGQYNFDTSITTGVWTHLAVVRRNGTFYGYVNGVLEPTSRTVSQAVTDNSIQYIGGGEGGSYTSRSYLQEFGLWTTDLTHREVRSLAMRKACSTQQPAKLAIYLPLSCRYGKILDSVRPAFPLTFTAQNGSATYYQDAPVTYFPRKTYPRHLNRGAVTVTVVDISGTVTVTFSPTGAIVGQGVVATSSTVAFAPLGTIVGLADLSTSSSVNFTPTATGVGLADLSSSSSVVFTPTATITGLADLTSSSVLTFTSAASLDGLAELASSTSLSFAAVASLAASVDLAASSTLTFSASSDLVGLGSVSASSAFAFDSASALTGFAVVQGSSLVMFAGTGTTFGSATFSGSASLAFVPTATVSGVGVAVGSSALSFVSTGDVVGILDLSGSVSATFTVTSSLYAIGVVSGSCTVTFTTNAHPDAGTRWYAECTPDFLLLTTFVCVVSEFPSTIETESVLLQRISFESELVLSLEFDSVMLEESTTQLRTGWYDG